MMVGERLNSSAELLWACALLGTGGERILYDALLECGCIGPDDRLLARQLAAFLSALWDAPDEPEVSLMWTLPDGLNILGVDASGYMGGVLRLIGSARQRLTLLAPYLEAEGIGRLQEELLIALARRVSVVLVTQDANVLGSCASASLESLRREARGLPGTLRVYSAPASAPVFLHSKLIVADGIAAIVGSANLTGNALLRNLETGVLVGARQAVEIEHVVQRAIELGHVQLLFTTTGTN
jgi:phosphatidylserine/phosphatidylglycerophosphate/cardiolipin synthase-like enzyme